MKGEVVKAYVALREGPAASPEELIAFCRQRLAPHKVPKAVEFRDTLPKTLIGKILRRALVEEDRRRVTKGQHGTAADPAGLAASRAAPQRPRRGRPGAGA